MCGRLSQYRGIRDFVATLSMPNALVNTVGDQPLGQYNAAPSTPLALLHLEGETLHADRVRWGWHPRGAKDRTTPINTRVEKIAHGAYFRAIWPHRAILPIDNWFEWVYEGGAKKQPYLIRRRDRAPILCASIGQYPAGGREPRDDDGFVIFTPDSEGGMVDVHDRRPVVLSPELAREWLNLATPKDRAEQIVAHLGEPIEAFEWFKVGMAIGNVRNLGAGLLKEVGPIVRNGKKGHA
ncbi:SOS response-associated peptidase family protein [Pseudomonas purpurea]|uniref:SOS response-associated peptidase family protein n=1 Tax=Pseudomonas purpurea TaxID=3136737 RepID=UPI0032658AD8